MDNTTQQPIQPTTPTPVPEQQIPASVNPEAPKNNKLLLMVGLLGVIILMGGAVGFLFLSQKTEKIAVVPSQKATTTPIATPSPTPEVTEEVNSIDTGDPTSDLSDIDKDLSTL